MTEEEIRLKYRDLCPKYEKLQSFVFDFFNKFDPVWSTLPYPKDFLVIKKRIKTEDSFVKKALRKDKKGNHKYISPFEEIYDFLGITIVCYTTEDMKFVANHLRYVFSLVPGSSLDDFGWRLEDDQFGHRALKLEFEINNDKTPGNNEAPAELKGLRFELQITSGFMFTWSKIQHDWLESKWDPKLPRPKPLMRQIYSVNALLELADKELSNIQIETEKMKIQDLTSKHLSLKKLRSFCDTYFYEWRKVIVDEYEERDLGHLVGIIQRQDVTLLDIKDFYESHKDAIIELERAKWKILNPRMRSTQYDIILTILQLMNPKYAYDSLKGTNKGPEIIELYNNWREKYLPIKI